MKHNTHLQQGNTVRAMSDPQEQLFSDDQTKLLKTIMAPALAEARHQRLRIPRINHRMETSLQTLLVSGYTQL